VADLENAMIGGKSDMLITSCLTGDWALNEQINKHLRGSVAKGLFTYGFAVADGMIAFTRPAPKGSVHNVASPESGPSWHGLGSAAYV
jgi:hypothetical protein